MGKLVFLLVVFLLVVGLYVACVFAPAVGVESESLAQAQEYISDAEDSITDVLSTVEATLEEAID